MAQFCFFTDPAKLAIQGAAEAFGPAAAAGGQDRFRVTDVHQLLAGATTPARAYAVCRGQVCLQAVRDSNGGMASLSLILRPLPQPAFDFPYVEYFIYRGLRVDSLLASDGRLDLGKEGTGIKRNRLISLIRKQYLKIADPSAQLEPNGYLGLGRNHDSSAPHGGPWGDDQPLDHLFRYSDGNVAPIVEAGWPLGTFGATFGFEIVVQRYGAQPTIGWARNADPWIQAAPVTTSANPSAAYASRLQREAIGCFVDPCAFWGMFWSAGLVLGPAQELAKDNVLEKRGDLLKKLFPTNSGNFINRKRVYLDIRNESGLSYDFYGAYQDGLKIVPDDDTVPAGRTFGIGGWPLHFVTLPQTGASAGSLSFRLRRDGTDEPLLFLQQAGRSLPGGKRFQEMLGPDADWTLPVTVTRPGEANAWPPWWFVGHYLRGQKQGQAPVAGPIGVDTSPLQFGPIGDRVIAAFRQEWPANGSSQISTDHRFTDKVLRYDGTLKDDPVPPQGATRALSYDRMGETLYIFRKGSGAAEEGSVIVVHSRGFERRQEFIGSWQAASLIEGPGWAADLLARPLMNKLLSKPVTIGLADGTITVHSSLELLNDTQLKAELFDFTILLLTKSDFEAAVEAAAPAGAPPPSPGTAHPVFLSLGPPEEQPLRASSFGLQWRSWDGQAATGAAASIPLYSADGIFFCSPGFPFATLGSPDTKATLAECPFAIDDPISPKHSEPGLLLGNKPFRIVHHVTESDTALGAIATFKGDKRPYPHFTVDQNLVYQHTSIKAPARALANLSGGVETNRLNAIQIEVVGYSGQPKNKLTLANVARLCRWIEEQWNIERIWPAGLPNPPTATGGDPGHHNRDPNIWTQQGGHYGHCHLPENTHWDPAYTKIEADFVTFAEFTSDGLVSNPTDPRVKPLLDRID